MPATFTMSITRDTRRFTTTILSGHYDRARLRIPGRQFIGCSLRFICYLRHDLMEIRGFVYGRRSMETNSFIDNVGCDCDVVGRASGTGGAVNRHVSAHMFPSDLALSPLMRRTSRRLYTNLWNLWYLEPAPKWHCSTSYQL